MARCHKEARQKGRRNPAIPLARASTVKYSGLPEAGPDAPRRAHAVQPVSAV